MRTLVLDTSGIIAIVNPDEPEHAAAIAALNRFDDFIIPALALVEVEHWMHRHGAGRAFAELLGEIRAGVYRVEAFGLDHLLRAAELDAAYASLGIGLVDASVIATCERHRVQDVLTLDRRDFSVVRPAHCRTLRLLPE